jgi:hypothetical protein
MTSEKNRPLELELDRDEQEILHAFEAGTLHLSKDQADFREIARNTLRCGGIS